MKKLLVLLFVVLFAGCVTAPIQGPPQSVDVKLKIEGVDSVRVAPEGSPVQRVMEVGNPALQFSNMTKLHGDTAYITLMDVGPYEAKALWGDMKLIELLGIKKVHIYMNNPGGSAFSGFDMSDRIRILKGKNVHVEIHGSGIIASAAIPMFVSAHKRVVPKNTIFLIHPATLHKWLASETLKDLDSQREMLNLLRQRYAGIVSDNSNLTGEQVLEMMGKDTWFGADEAKEWGLADEII